MAGEKKKKRQQKAKKKAQEVRRQEKKQEQVQKQTVREAEGLVKSFFAPKPIESSLLDLHGLSEADAKETTIKHLRLAPASSRHRIVTGRGNHVNARGKRGTLYNTFPDWLCEVDERIETVEQHDGYYVVEIKSFDISPSTYTLPSLSLDAISEGAEAGDAECQWLLSRNYELGEMGSEKNEKLAFKWCKASAEQGHLQAMENLAQYYYFGKGVRKSDDLAIEWLQSAIEAGSERASLNLGCIYWQIQQHELSFRTYLHAAETYQNPIAQFYVSHSYCSGKGVEQDLKRAIHYLELSAEQGHDVSYNALARSYRKGIGVEVDFDRCIYYLTLSSALGNSFADFELGRYFYYGYGVAENRDQALIHFKKSAEKHYGPAHAQLFYHYHNVESDEVKAAEHLKLAAEMSCLDAELLYYESILPQNSDEKDRYKRKLLKHKSEEYEALTIKQKILLAKILLIEFSSKKARILRKKVFSMIKQDPTPGCFFALGAAAFTKNNIADAVNCWEIGDSLFEPVSFHALGRCYLSGRGVEQDIERATVLFQKGAKDGVVYHHYELGLIAYKRFRETQDNSDEDTAEFHFRQAVRNNRGDESIYPIVVGLHYSGVSPFFLACKKLGNLLSTKARSYYDEATVQESIEYLEKVKGSEVAGDELDAYLQILNLRKCALEKKRDGNNEFRKKNYDDAMVYYGMAIGIASQYKKAYPLSIPPWTTIKVNIGLCHKRKGDIDQAKQYFLAVLDDDEKHYKALLNIADLFFDEGDYENAHSYASKAHSVCDGSQSKASVARLEEIVEGCARIFELSPG